MGALQEFVAVRARRVPPALAFVLGFIPHVYLGAAILFAATGGGFPICKLDPFVGVFRLGAPVSMMIWGALILLLGVFVARPYCRFLCPYGVLIGWASCISKYKVPIHPKGVKCVNCRLCEGVCPTDAILAPAAVPTKERRVKSVGRLKMYILLIPVWAAAFAAAGWFTADLAAALHPDVKLLRIVERDLADGGAGAARSFESEALRVDEQVLATLRDNAAAAKRRFAWGMMLAGIYLGVVVGGSLARRAMTAKREGYEADAAACVECGRCFGRCPKT